MPSGRYFSSINHQLVDTHAALAMVRNGLNHLVTRLLDYLAIENWFEAEKVE